MTKARPTIAEVARRAGVSPATVSRVLNGTARVSPEKVRAVLQAVEELGYAPSPLAQGLATGRSYAVGILLSDFASPFFGPILGPSPWSWRPPPTAPSPCPATGAW